MMQDVNSSEKPLPFCFLNPHKPIAVICK